jgi:hypothetical protein
MSREPTAEENIWTNGKETASKVKAKNFPSVN